VTVCVILLMLIFNVDMLNVNNLLEIKYKLKIQRPCGIPAETLAVCYQRRTVQIQLSVGIMMYIYPIIDSPNCRFLL